MKEIGGYFELELNEGQSSYHTKALFALKNGRACLRYILETTRPKKIYIPYYSCHVILEPIQQMSIQYEFYEIDNQLTIKNNINIQNQELILYINYFGLKSNYCNKLEKKYAHQLIIDNTHAFFLKPNQESKTWYFNSCRKYFGVPDGAYLYAPKEIISVSQNLKTNTNYSVKHLLKRLNYTARNGYQDFLDNEELLDNNLELMSKFSFLLLSHVDYQKVSIIRRNNFLFLHTYLDENNQLSHLCQHLEKQTPFSYPYKPKHPIKQQILWENKIFVPILWKECNSNKYKYEKDLAENILHIPIDHRYDAKDMKEIITKIKNIEQQIEA